MDRFNWTARYKRYESAWRRDELLKSTETALHMKSIFVLNTNCMRIAFLLFNSLTNMRLLYETYIIADTLQQLQQQAFSVSRVETAFLSDILSSFE